MYLTGLQQGMSTACAVRAAASPEGVGRATRAHVCGQYNYQTLPPGRSNMMFSPTTFSSVQFGAASVSFFLFVGGSLTPWMHPRRVSISAAYSLAFALPPCFRTISKTVSRFRRFIESLLSKDGVTSNSQDVYKLMAALFTGLTVRKLSAPSRSVSTIHAPISASPISCPVISPIHETAFERFFIYKSWLRDVK